MRAVQELDSGVVDAHVGTFVLSMDGYIFPRWHYFLSNIGVIFKKGLVDEWQGYKTLSGKRVGWIRGYYFNLFFDKKIPLQVLEVTNLEQCINLIKAGRLDFCMDGLVNGLHPMSKQMRLSEDLFQVETLFLEPAYMRFLNTKRARKIITMFDERMDALFASGELHRLFLELNFPPISPEQSALARRPTVVLRDILNGVDDWADFIEHIKP